MAKKRGKNKKQERKININIKTIIWVVIIIIIFFPLIKSFFTFESGNTALIQINGMISASKQGFFSGGTVDDIIYSINQAESNPKIKAIIFEINSPGGTAEASKELADKIKSINKTTIAVIREIGTSGAYWAASSCDKIVASPLSITGSIGVIASYMQFTGLLRKYNITYNRIVSGEYKDVGNPFVNLTKEKQKILMNEVMQVYNIFVENIAENRNMSIEDVKKIADGRFYLGKEAKEIGLIDYLGDINTAKEIIKQEINETPKIIEYKKKASLFGKLSELISKQSFYLGQGIASYITQQNYIRFE